MDGVSSPALGCEQDRIDALLRDVRLNRVAALIEAMFEKSNLNSDEIRKARLARFSPPSAFSTVTPTQSAAATLAAIRVCWSVLCVWTWVR